MKDFSGRVATAPARRALVAASAGTIIEWFDYALYGALAAILAGDLFFPRFSPGLATLAAFGAYGVAFFVRPLGGLVLGRIGDRRGRKPALMISLVLMGGCTVAVALVPTYSMIGVYAPILLVLLRVGQGFGAGAEVAGAIALVAEYAPLERRGLYTAVLQSTSLIGVLLSSLAFLSVSALPHEAMQSWGWRVPFLSAGLLFGVALYLRTRLEESPEYRTAMARAENRDEREHRPLALLFATMKRRLFLAFMLINAWNVLAAVLAVFIASYLRNTVRMPATYAFAILSIGTVVGVVSTIFFGAVCDKCGFRRIWMTSLAVTIPGVFLLFLGLRTGVFWLAAGSMALAYAIAYGPGAGAFPGVLANLFPTEVRYSGIAAVREVSAATVAGTVPFVATALVLAGGGTPWLVAGYVAVWALLGLICYSLLGNESETPESPNLFVKPPNAPEPTMPETTRRPATEPVQPAVKQ
ncbi:MFS transporter [Nocardia aobensis]|uniref:MFS transporter n=1 Tax=Nocardia aobensis TaxID=257277 RepID=A0ABW6P9I9_9NOCA